MPMKTIFRKTISVILLLTFAYSSASLIGFDPMPLSSVQTEQTKKEPESSPEIETTIPISIGSDEAEVAVSEPVPPGLDPKPEYSFPDGFTTQLLTPDWFEECPFPGIVEMVEYPATDYHSGKEIIKKMDVYLPFGYSQDVQYDVLILTHGAGGDEGYWFSEDHEYGGEKVNAKNLVDNMVSRKVCRPLIIASVTCTNEETCSGKSYNWDQLLLDGTQLSREIAEDILPFLAENYSTYASGPDSMALSQARDHFAYFGLSWSAMFGYLTILPEDMAYFSWYALIAPSKVNLSDKLGTISEKNELYPVHSLYAGVGSKDKVRYESEAIYSALIRSGTFSDGRNAYQVITDNVNHHFESWCTSLYNCLLLFF